MSTTSADDVNSNKSDEERGIVSIFFHSLRKTRFYALQVFFFSLGVKSIVCGSIGR